MFNNIINDKAIKGKDFDSIFICQDENQFNIIRVSWFKDCHFRDELFINLAEKQYDHPELRNRIDWYNAGEGQNIDIYFSYSNKYLSIDIFYHDEMKVVSRNYDLEELYEIASLINC